MSEIEEMIQPQENDSASPDELDVINVEETPISNGGKLQQMAENVSYYRRKTGELDGIKVVSASLTGIFSLLMIVSYLLGKDSALAESLIGAIVNGLVCAISSLDYKSWEVDLEKAQEEYERLKEKIETNQITNQEEDRKVK